MRVVTKTPALVVLLAHLWIMSSFLVLAFDTMRFVYETDRLVPRETSTLGGAAPTVTDTGDPERPYGVDGNTFMDYVSAAQRSCSVQFDVCQKAANGNSSADFTVQDCQSQMDACLAEPSPTEQTNGTTTTVPTTTTTTALTVMNNEAISHTTNSGLTAQTTMPYDDEYDLVCDL